jgi:hypothetical protein
MQQTGSTEHYDRQARCPVCRKERGKIGPQHMKTHGLTRDDAYRGFPGLGFTKRLG